MEHKPILTYSPRETRSFRIASLFYAALFGGAITAAAMGLLNARMLMIKGKKLALLWTVSILFVAVKIAYEALLLPVAFEVDHRLLFPLFKLPDLLLFLFFYHMLKTPYRLHMIYHGNYHYLFHRGIALLIGAVSIAIDLTIVTSSIMK
ncbi:hypothetical protein PaecuDRAFT_3458 [Paenibacillus curdlanolyticus YK9]|uniref:Uncharacterized protein n=1 Tax=Paenibacillus curdlanolyticus YK9 TaxID=717606 RepID=E0ICR9_9BACL|nr:hypothetical protein [Paenibacillus curdlanolyticus]EFM09955.1 hypothetical protein PaecuDRAFT_3458 [Paenibacillus curdlanolyticus YK9]